MVHLVSMSFLSTSELKESKQTLKRVKDREKETDSEDSIDAISYTSSMSQPIYQTKSILAHASHCVLKYQ